MTVRSSTYISRKFLRIDKNKDKKLNFGDGSLAKKESTEQRDERKKGPEAQRIEYFAELFQEFDENFDMSLNQDELKNMLARRLMVKPKANFSELFSSFDKDKNGRLDVFGKMIFYNESRISQFSQASYFPLY
ncbi:hypothetical protein OESDEN_12847 [Oesophagostomum dentatum]|uniref:EF-hand domain-containing protein n=1 Tax=Oesophagostomum dentatum TaxID=61180 RepID=A0A0B1SU02_OESDE|nr:hypothetical protein OESDEN_12847 [Oesophagostomum dentatum]